MHRDMSGIIGHERQIRYLNKTIASGRVSHAYLFHGPEEVGKRTIALGFVQALLCEKKPTSLDATCGSCASCAAAERSAHPNFLILDPEHHADPSSAEKNAITIDDIREVKRLFSYVPTASSHRALVMDQAEKMTRDASSAFLKLFEEPGECAVMILVTSAPDLLPQTILSRAQTIGFSLVRDAPSAAYQATRNPSSGAAKLRALAQGRPGRLIRLLRDQAFQKEQEKLFSAAEEIIERRNTAVLFALSERVASDPRLRVQCIESAFSILRGRLLSAAGSGNSLRIARTIHSVDRIATILETANVNPRLAMDALLLAAADAARVHV